MCALCIISSYFYASLIGFRYTFEADQRKRVMITMLVFESLFLLQFLLQFIREFKLDGFPPERNIAKIVMQYMKEGSFKIDLVCLLPLGIIPLYRHREFLFLIIKMLRLVKGFELLNVQALMDKIKKIQHERTQRIVDSNGDQADNKDLDLNNVEKLLLTSYTLRIFKLILVIANVSYITGVGWLVLCEAVRDFILNIGIGEERLDNGGAPAPCIVYDSVNEKCTSFETYPVDFIDNYGILDNSREQNIIISIYFAFTSLSTVGFGDYAPRSNIERLLGS